MRPHHFAAFVALLVAAATPAVARADATDEARAAYDEGARAYDARDYATAARSFALADERVPSPRALELAMSAALQAFDAPLHGSRRACSCAARSFGHDRRPCREAVASFFG